MKNILKSWIDTETIPPTMSIQRVAQPSADKRYFKST